jgi:hypothetical protein
MDSSVSSNLYSLKFGWSALLPKKTEILYTRKPAMFVSLVVLLIVLFRDPQF